MGEGPRAETPREKLNRWSAHAKVPPPAFLTIGPSDVASDASSARSGLPREAVTSIYMWEFRLGIDSLNHEFPTQMDKEMRCEQVGTRPPPLAPERPCGPTGRSPSLEKGREGLHQLLKPRRRRLVQFGIHRLRHGRTIEHALAPARPLRSWANQPRRDTDLRAPLSQSMDRLCFLFHSPETLHGE